MNEFIFIYTTATITHALHITVSLFSNEVISYKLTALVCAYLRTQQVDMSFMLLWHRATGTSISAVYQLSTTFLLHFDFVLLMKEMWVLLTTLICSSLQHFVVRSMMDFRCLSIKTFFSAYILTSSFLPFMVQLCCSWNNCCKQSNNQTIHPSSHILGKMYLGEERRLGKKDGERHVVKNHQRGLRLCHSVWLHSCRYWFKHLAVTCGSTVTMYFCISKWHF